MLGIAYRWMRRSLFILHNSTIDIQNWCHKHQTPSIAGEFNIILFYFPYSGRHARTYPTLVFIQKKETLNKSINFICLAFCDCDVFSFRSRYFFRRRRRHTERVHAVGIRLLLCYCIYRTAAHGRRTIQFNCITRFWMIFRALSDLFCGCRECFIEIAAIMMASIERQTRTRILSTPRSINSDMIISYC